MKTLSLSVVFALSVMIAPSAHAERQPAESGNEVIIEVAPGVSPVDVAREYGIEIRYIYKNALNGFSGRLITGDLPAIRRDPRVMTTEWDRPMLLDDPVTEQRKPPVTANWGLDRIDQRKLPLDGIYHEEATGAGVTAYIIDSGIRYDHKEFDGRASLGYDVAGWDGRDCNGHGTHVAGIVGGKTFGVAKDVKLVSVAVFSCGGGGTTAAIIAGVDWVIGHHQGPSVANMSVLVEGSALLDRAVRNMIASGVATAIAAGNNWTDACWFSPGRISEGMTTAATDSKDHAANFSNYGQCVFLFAPGVSILSADIPSSSATVERSGTSMASPHTAGVAALYLEKHPLASAAEVREALGGLSTKNIVDTDKTAARDILFSLETG